MCKSKVCCILEKVHLQTLGEIKALQPLFLPKFSVGMLPL